MTDYYHSLDRKEIEGVPLGEIGFSTAPMKDQLDELKAKIRAGVSKVELGFWGKGKGYGENLTPGSYGAEERKALKDIAKINQVELTTHATPNVGPISGFTQQGFREESRKESVDEIKRAIDFAAEVTDGGPVVMHTGEFVRPIFAAGERIEDKDGKSKFQAYRYHGEKDDEGKLIKHTEEDQATMYLADEKTGQIIDSVKKDQPIFLPIYERDEDGKIKFKKETNGDGVERLVPIIKENPNGEAEIKDYSWKEVEELTKQFNKKKGTKFDPQEWYFQQKIEEKINEMEGSKAYYQELLDEGSQFRVSDERKKGLKKSIMATDQRIKEMELMRSHAKPIETVAIAKSAESLADLGLHAMEKQKAAKLKKDLYVSPENIFPEQYGGHPDELKKMVQEGRNRMKEKLIDQGWSKSNAEDEAAKHIKATFDIGHAYTWRKYFKGNDKEFKGWLMDKVKDMQKTGVLGHVHVSDNFGYADEHIDPGQGKAPIKEVVEKLKGEVDFVVETGRQGERALLSAFKEFGSPIYGIRPNQWDPWDVIENSYFGRTSPPYFMVGEVSQQMGERVSKDFSSWAGIPFE